MQIFSMSCVETGAIFSACRSLRSPPVDLKVSRGFTPSPRQIELNEHPAWHLKRILSPPGLSVMLSDALLSSWAGHFVLNVSPDQLPCLPEVTDLKKASRSCSTSSPEEGLCNSADTFMGWSSMDVGSSLGSHLVARLSIVSRRVSLSAWFCSTQSVMSAPGSSPWHRSHT